METWLGIEEIAGSKPRGGRASVQRRLQESVPRDTCSNGGSASTRLCIGPYMVAGRMAVYRESSKEAEYATVEHTRASFTYPPR